MGALYRSVCYESSDVARDYLISDCNHVDATYTGQPQGWSCQTSAVVAGAVKLDRYVASTGLVHSSAVLVPTFPACTVLNNNPFLWSAEDGFILSAAVVGVWAVAFATRALIRALNAADNSSDIEE